MYDVLVIGTGMAGCIAALEARRLGAKVAVASRSWGATALSSGALDIAYTPALSRAHQMPRTLAEHVLDIIAHRRRHPYAVLGVERTIANVEKGFAALAKALAPSELNPRPLDFEAENVSLPSSLGALLPAASALAPHVGLDLVAPVKGTIGVLQLPGLWSFDARRVTAGVRHDAAALGVEATGLEVVPVSYDAAVSAPVLARRLDDLANVDVLARALAGKGKGFVALLAPPVLGLDRHAWVRQRLSVALGAPLVETLAHTPSVPGMRLQRALDRAVRAAGIDGVGDVAAVAIASGKVTGVTTVDQLEINAGAFVLATGRFVAGGVGWGERPKESLFDLPIASEEGPLEADGPDAVLRETPMESHPLMTAGITVNSALAPMREGRVAHANLFAAGMVIGGFASRYVLCADGVAMATGVEAGRNAALAAGAAS
ncbi:MAG: FAD-dependent oxidoreductase [Deltaproteobacteria bacterium]|nr:FAD-dependent oxidoreductase [Deltaproteobacteria bacterium]